jgi:heptosyltransferase-2
MGLRVLVRTPNHLGDCIMALPMISETREAYPGATVTVLTPEPLADLFVGNTGIDNLWAIPTRHVHGLIGVMKLKEMIGRGAFDIGYILPPSFGAASSFKLAGVKERIGYIADGRRLLLTKPLPLSEPLNSQHRSVVYFDLLRRGAGVSFEYAPPKLVLNDTDRERASTTLAESGLGPNDEYVVIGFQAVAQSRRWGGDRYAALAQRIVGGLNRSVVLIGAGGDRKAGDQVMSMSGIGSIYNVAGMTTLRESAAVLSRAEAFVGNDSGPAHLAAAAGAKLIVLSGADDPAETSPISNRKAIIRRDRLSCIGCVKNVCPLKGDAFMRCMKEISVEEVYEALRDMVRGG